MTRVIYRFCFPSLLTGNNDLTSPLERESTVFPGVWSWQNSFPFDGPSSLLHGNRACPSKISHYGCVRYQEKLELPDSWYYAIKFLFPFADSYFAGQCWHYLHHPLGRRNFILSACHLFRHLSSLMPPHVKPWFCRWPTFLVQQRNSFSQKALYFLHTVM